MALEIKDVKLEVNKPEINFDAFELEKSEKEKLKKKKAIIIVYNSLNKQPHWLPPYMSCYENEAEPFWIKNDRNGKIANYEFIKKALGY